MSKISLTIFADSLRKKLLRLTLLGLLIGLIGIISIPDYKVTGQQSPVQSCPTCKPPAQQIIYTPLIESKELSYSEINLNCRSSHPIDVIPTFYTAEGMPVIGETIHLLPAEMRFIDIQSLIPTEHRGKHGWGGMSLSYTGNTMEVWAQMTLHGITKNGSVNSLFAVVDARRSNIREAVWRMPKNAVATIALGNYSDMPAAATLTFSSGDVEQINLAPYATEILQRKSNGQNVTKIEAESVTISSNGQTGRLITTGFVSLENGDFGSSIRFADPENVAQPNLYSTNFRLKDTAAHIVLKNTTTSPITARPRFLPMAGEGSGVVELPVVTIQPNAIKEVNLTTLMNVARTRPDFDSVGVQIINGGTAGSLIGAANFTNNVTGIDYDIPLRDSGTAQNSAGGYPIRLDDDYTTNLSITNVGDKAGQFTLQVNFGGGLYAMYPRELAPGETAVFDFRKIRDQQIPDSSGKVLPLNLAVAQIRWSMIGRAQTRMIGRSEIISKSGKVSSSYSCGVCCRNSYQSSRLTPDQVFAYFDDVTQFAAKETDTDCYGGQFYEYTVTYPTWSSSDTSVADFYGANGAAYALNDGGTQITATWDANYSIDNGSDGCMDIPVVPAPTAGMDVRPRVTDVTANGATKISQILGNQNIIHFVTPKGAANSQVTLTATITSVPQQDLSKIDWEGATESANNPLQATLSKDTASKNIVKIKYNGSTIKELRVWVVWATITSTSPSDFSIQSSSNGQFGNPPGTGLVTRGGYRFTHTIEPATIITDTNRPDFSGSNTNPPPGGNHPIFVNDPLSGGANKKWDVSRQIRLKVLNPANIGNNDFTTPAFPNIPNYPMNDVEGNDNRNVVNETNDPYSNNGVLTDADRPEYGIVDRAASDGDTYEARLQFREFTRLEIEGTWTRISDYYLWRIHFKFLKVNGLWTDNGTNKALDNNGF
jgi:hypothetical protein